MKKFPRILCCLILVLVFAVVILPEIKEGFGIGKSYAAENSYEYASDERVYYDTFVFSVYGYGHGVGMSQDGAMTMAKDGSTYEEILTHYYPGTTVKKDSSTPATIKYGGVDIPIVEYLCKATKKEMGYSSAGKEALKAQIAAIYTFAKHYNFDVSKSKHAYDENFEYKGSKIHEACLEYLGMETNEDTPVAKYVDYNGKAAYTCCFSNSAGKTASAQSVWGTDKYPYLKGGVSSPEDVDLSTKEIRATEMKKLIESYAKDIDISIKLSDNPAEWLEIISYDVIAYKESGYVDKIRVGNITVSGNTFRNNILDFRIKSHCFDLAYLPAETTTTAKAEYTTEAVTAEDYTIYPTTTKKHPITSAVYPTDNNIATTAKVNPKEVVGIYVPDMTVIKETRGDWASQHSEECPDSYCTHRYFHYNVYPRELTVAFRDGTNFTGSVDEVTELTCTAFGYQNNQYYETQWSSGNSYYVTCWLGRASTTYKVSVIDTPVESVELKFDKPQFTENVDGYLNYKLDENGKVSDSYFFYDVSYYTAEITFKEGYEYYQDTNYSQSITYDQSFDNPWGVGKHTVTFSCLGYEEDFEVEVVPNTNKIKSVSVEKAGKLYDGIDSRFISDSDCNESGKCHITPEYKSYDVENSNPVITVEYEDGTVISEDFMTMRDIMSRKNSAFAYYFTMRIVSHDSYENQWGFGKNTAYLVFFDQVVPFEVEVVPNPISGIEFVKAPDKTEYMDCECSDIRGAVVRINYKDGDHLDVPLNRDRYFWNTYYYDPKLDRIEELFIDQYVYDNKINIILSGEISCSYPITVKENDIKYLSFRNSENGEFIITAYKYDGTSEEMKAISYNPDDGGERYTAGHLTTDKGIFWIDIYSDYDGSYHVGFNGGQWGFHKIDRFPFLKLIDKCNALNYEFWGSLAYNKTGKEFSGKITEDNIDLIVLMSLVANGNEDYTGTFDADIIKKIISKNFDISNIDLTLSKRYNPANNTITTDESLLADFSRHKTIRPENRNGYWYVEMSDYDDDKMLEPANLYFVFDKNLKIVAFSTEKMPVIEKPYLEIRQPTETVISYGDSIILHADATEIPANGYIEWSASNGNFDMKVSADGSTCTISPKKSGDTTFTATIYDAEGNIVSSDEQVMTSKAGFFDKIIAFFKKLFGLTKTIPEAIKVIY